VNVLYLNHVATAGGAEMSLRALLHELRRAHPEISTVLAMPDGAFCEQMRAENFMVAFAPLRRIERPKNLPDAGRALFHILRSVPPVSRLVSSTQSDVVHCNSTTAHMVGGLAAAVCNRPAIWHARDVVSLGRMAPLLAARAARVIAISGCVAEKLQNDGVPAEKICVIHNGLDPDEWQPRDRSSWRENQGFARDDFVFGCLAQVVEWKNHAAFIEAAAQLHADQNCGRARFVIAGEDYKNGEHGRQLREKVNALNLQHCFDFVSHQKDSVDLMAGLDALVLPSREEPFGRVLIEAMAMQKPVVAYANGGPLEIVTHEHDGLLVVPEESDGLAKAMKRILTENDLREHLAHHARATVLQKFHIRDHAAKVHQLYRDVL
jgi:glycosyltransferase involved in cell wall biosynthesis